MDKWRRHAAERSRIVYANNSTRDRVEYIPCSSSLCISRNFQLAKTKEKITTEKEGEIIVRFFV